MTDPRALREKLVETARALTATGLTHGTSGNASARLPGGMLITPSGVPCEALTPEGIAEVGGGGETEPRGPAPSSEWRMHLGVYRARPEVGAIVHVHSPYATAIACTRRPIPAFHYMVAIAGGDSIPCVPYALFGSQSLADHAVAALEDRRACLLANHGMIAVGADPEGALYLAREVEAIARHYHLSLQIGGPVTLSDAEMQEVRERFAGYGRRGG